MSSLTSTIFPSPAPVRFRKVTRKPETESPTEKEKKTNPGPKRGSRILRKRKGKKKKFDTLKYSNERKREKGAMGRLRAKKIILYRLSVVNYFFVRKKINKFAIVWISFLCLERVEKRKTEKTNSRTTARIKHSVTIDSLTATHIAKPNLFFQVFICRITSGVIFAVYQQLCQVTWSFRRKRPWRLLISNRLTCFFTFTTQGASFFLFLSPLCQNHGVR